MVFHTTLNNSKYPKVCWILLSILADLNNAVVWSLLVILFPNSPAPVPATNYNWCYPHPPLQCFFSSPTRSLYLSLFSLSFSFTQWSTRMAKSSIMKVLFIFWWLSLGLVVWPRLGDLFISQNPKELCAPRLLGRSPGYVYNICSFGQIKLFTQFQIDHFPIQSCLIL